MRSLRILLLLAGLVAADLADAETATLEADGLREAILRFQAQEIEVAEELLLAARESRPGDAETSYYLGRVYLSQGRAKKAIDLFEEAIGLDPTVSAYPFWLAEALVARIDEVAFFFKLGLANRLRAAYEKAVELDPENLEARVSVARYHSEAPSIAGGSSEKATAQLAEIRRRDPALAHVTQGLIHEQLGRLEEAAEAFETAVEVDPESILSWRELGYFYQRMGRWEDAGRAFEEVLKRAPNDPAALYEAAHTAIELGPKHLKHAEATLKTYLQLEPGPDPLILNGSEPPRRAVARERLELVYERLGKDAVREVEARPGAQHR